MEPQPGRPFSRRRFLGGGTAAVGLALVGCSSESSDGASATSTTATSSTAAGGSSSTTTAATTTTAAASTTTVAGSIATGTPATTVFTAADFAGLGACITQPEVTAGPFPSPELWERRDLTEGKPGLALRIGALVVDDACAPLPGAVVEFWHCDADGDYSAYTDGAQDPADDEGEGTTFLRGTQTANADGIVEFATIYPGWYTGRAVHIHTRVHRGDATIVTTQLYFPDDLNHEVFASAPYHGDPDTTNGTDAIAGGDPADWGALFTVSDDPDGGRRALAVIAVDPDARSQETGFMTPPAGSPPAR